MQLGDPVRGLMMNLHWRFVLSDAHRIADAVNAYDSRARLVAHDEDQRIAVARFITSEALGGEITDDLLGAPVADRGGVFMLVFKPKRGDGTDMVGEPDASVMEQLRQRDVHARRRGLNERELKHEFEQINAIREAKAAERLLERTTARTEERMFDWAKREGVPWRPSRAYIPSDRGSR